MKISLKITYLFLTLVILTTMTFSIPQPVKGESRWFDSTWQYRVPIIIDNTNNTLPLRNYVLFLNLDYTNFDFYKANTSGYDFRFTNDDGLTLLNHDIEYYNYPDSARIKLLLPYAPAKANSLIYLYYGAKISVANTAENISTDVLQNAQDHLMIFDNGIYRAPSDWQITGSNQNAKISQTSNIFTYDSPVMSGTYALVKGLKFTSGDFDFEMMSQDDDGIGLIFGSQDINNYYRLAWFKQGKKVLTDLPGDVLGSGLFLQKKQNGNWSTLSHKSDIFEQDQWYDIKIKLDEKNIKIYINGRKLIDKEDKSFRGPWIGLYSWANQGSHFRNILNLAGYENPDLYLPVNAALGQEELYENILAESLAQRQTLRPPTILIIDEYKDVKTNYVYITKSPCLIAGVSPYGWPVRIYIDDQNAGNATVRNGELSGTANFYIKPSLQTGSHTLTTAVYNPETGEESRSPQSITLEVK